MQFVPPVLHTRPQQQEPYHDAGSAYSLSTVPDLPSPTQHTALLGSPSSSSTQTYGTTAPTQPSSRRLLVNATLKMALIFVLSTAFLGTTLWLALPTLEECGPLAVAMIHIYLLAIISERTDHI